MRVCVLARILLSLTLARADELNQLAQSSQEREHATYDLKTGRVKNAERERGDEPNRERPKNAFRGGSDVDVNRSRWSYVLGAGCSLGRASSMGSTGIPHFFGDRRLGAPVCPKGHIDRVEM
jgi:hypothetical protein